MENFNLHDQIIEDIVDTIDGQSLTKSSDYTGFKKFLLGCLEALDIDVSRFMGEYRGSQSESINTVLFSLDLTSSERSSWFFFQF